MENAMPTDTHCWNCKKPMANDSRTATCSDCLNWEPRQNSGMGDGYCQIFDKFTDPDHGKRCTAFQPNDPAMASADTQTPTTPKNDH
jgi:hypothetical protein